MHEKIIQVSSNPISRDEWVDETSFYDGFSGWIADYVDDEVDDSARADIIKDFKESIHNAYPKEVSLKEDSFVLKSGFGEYFFTETQERLKEIVQKEFNSFLEMKFAVEPLIGDPYGTYVYEEGYGLSTLMSFLSRARGEYFFGAVIDYHY